MLLTAAIVGLFVLPGPWNVIALCAAAVVEVAEIYLWRLYLNRFRVLGGSEGMIGERAEVIEPCLPAGRVKVHGEIWAATAADGQAFAAGERVRVLGVDGLNLEVGPLEQ